MQYWACSGCRWCAALCARSPAPARAAQSRPAQTPPRSRPAQIETNDELYQELHNKISSRSFNSRVAQALTTVKDVVQEKSFLNVVEVVKGGSVGPASLNIFKCRKASKRGVRYALHSELCLYFTAPGSPESGFWGIRSGRGRRSRTARTLSSCSS